MAEKDVHKANMAEMEVASKHDEQDVQKKADYAGAVSKTDAAEIALCRKLDRRVLPVLWTMYYLYGSEARYCHTCPSN